MFIEKCSTFIVTFVRILYFDWLLGPHTGQNLEKHSKFFFSETVTLVKPVLCIHNPDSSLYIICVFYSIRIRTVVAIEISYFSGAIADIRILFLQKCLLSSGLRFL